MQNKGLVKFFAILFAILCIYQLTFTWVAGNIEDDAKLYAKGNADKEVKYLDSMGKIPVYPVLGYTYNEVRDKQINKGLDLEGGVNVTLEISVKEILKTLSNNSDNPVFNKALDEATKNKQGNQDYLDAFFVAFAQVSNGTPLASPDIFGNINLAGEINTTMSDDQVKKVIAKKVSESIDSAYGVLAERIDKFGVAQPNIMRLGESGRILVELPGVKDIDRATKLLQSTAQLEFWEVYKAQDVFPYLSSVNTALQNASKTEKDTAATADAGKLLGAKDSLGAKKGSNPLLDKLKMERAGGAILGEASLKDTAAINAIFRKPEMKSMLPNNLQFVRFVWGKADDKKNDGLVQLYALKTNRDNVAPLAGNVITDAVNDFDQAGKPIVSMKMNLKGAQKWEEMTGKAYREQGFIAIVLDNVVYSAPTVTSGPIAGGSSQISGNFDVTETKDLANILRAGKLPAKADIAERQVVGPSLGQEAIDNGITSSIVGLLLVCAWMWVYYGKAGTYANIALLVNLLFLFGLLASLSAVLTLPGIAGIVLTMGTAVDANIIIYERAKEELRHGKSLEEAVKTSYSWRGAMSSITDANVTHVLTGAVLFIFGSGLVKGFATTLLIGIFTSLFTSLFVTRIFLDRAVKKGTNLTFVTGLSKNWFTNFHFDFLGAKKFTYIFSSLVVIVSVVSFFVNGLEEGIDFAGGRTYTVRFEKPISDEDVREELGAAFGENVDVKRFGGDNQLRLTTKYKVDEKGEGVDKEITTILYNGLKKHYTNLSYEQFVNNNDDKVQGIIQSSTVSGSVADDAKTNAYWAVLGAMAIVFVYLMVSFRKWQYSLGAIAAVAHDVIFVLGIYSLCYKFMPFHMEIDQHFIAAILTVIGYSMNDTVIVFDRVREFLAGNLKGSFREVVNASINTTMSRTINTSLTMVIVLAIMFVFGGESIRGFVFAMLTGIVVGTYSSLFIATPVLVDSVSKKDKEEIERRHNESQEAA
ncbi:preprotein translocase subunit SecD [Flavobacterium akiainvivens]|uniref:Multifunctional fusion protein n=1 Tax=Flavobacterium akiainvivens TaxID=1202724 RepID=A0A0M8MEP3_9FLAO|nr:protein translocase subunit SecDF [Flavobacterium akiainvivens]KOS04701.1 preprotein translocase subunit SecD [Flavobacterium akiainvivens]SFQ64878.1 protein translocase subunit secF /protein translocase subunit secD [Flavobacterium akiainvivens]